MQNVSSNHSLRSEHPLGNHELQTIAPSIFAAQPWQAMSSKYTFIPTSAIVDKMRSEGFQPFSATQSRTRIPGKGEFTKHMIRFRDVRNGDVPAIRTLGTIYPELVLTNSHDGASAYKLDAGLFRLVCLNGLVVCDSSVSQINVRHSGDAGAVIDATYQVVEQFPKVLESVEQFSALQLTAGEQRAFASAALDIRYDADDTPVTPEQILRPRRVADQEPHLWNTLNVVQERLTQGGTPGRNPQTLRRQKVRAVTGISENTRLNKALWTLAEEMRKLKG